MTPENRFQNVSVLGAAGKMGSGIVYLVAIYVAQLKLSSQGKKQIFVIHAIDQSHDRLNGLISYLRSLLLKWAEKNIVWLREAYAHRENLVENGEIIQAFVTEAMDLIKPTTNIEAAYDSLLIFEAVLENVELKTKVLSQIKKYNPNDPWFLTNTSSIPINILNEQAQLNGNIVGCHFYNPPAVQKLIEVIEIKNANKDLSKLVYDFGEALYKKMVPANDIAGFIGNGFFMRDILFAIEKVKLLQTEFNFAESVLIIDTVSRDFMLRPMGIFQLVDYVGIDVCTFILQVMNKNLEDELHSELLVQLMERGVKGGQNADGSQKTGFFSYAKGKFNEIYDFDSNSYLPIDQILPTIKEYLGQLPEEQSWKALSRQRNRELILESFFAKLNKASSHGCKLAKEYMKTMKQIGEQLVESHVTNSSENVNTVMITGFHHIYGPINNYC